MDIEVQPDIWASLSESFTEWIHRPDLWRRLADSPVAMTSIAAGEDVRPAWPLEQLAELVPSGRFSTVTEVPHDFWSTHPDVWRTTVAAACEQL